MEEEILNAIIKVTNNFEDHFHGSTMMGWVRNYDRSGRLVSVNNNYRTGNVTIDNQEYYFVRRGWIVRIWDKPVTYMAFLNDTKDFIREIDIKPDYVKDYEELQKSKNQ